MSRASRVPSQLRSIARQGLAEFGDRLRRVEHAELRRDEADVGDVLIPLLGRQWSGAEPAVGSQEAVDLGDVDPAQQVRIARPDRPGRQGRCPARCRGRPDTGDGAFGDVDRAERGGGEELARPLEPAPRVAAVAGVPGDTGHRQRVQGLQHEGAAGRRRTSLHRRGPCGSPHLRGTTRPRAVKMVVSGA